MAIPWLVIAYPMATVYYPMAMAPGEAGAFVLALGGGNAMDSSGQSRRGFRHIPSCCFLAYLYEKKIFDAVRVVAYSVHVPTTHKRTEKMENVPTQELLKSIEKFQGICKKMPCSHPEKPVIEGVLRRLYAEMAKRQAA